MFKTTTRTVMQISDTILVVLIVLRVSVEYLSYILLVQHQLHINHAFRTWVSIIYHKNIFVSSTHIRWAHEIAIRVSFSAFN